VTGAIVTYRFITLLLKPPTYPRCRLGSEPRARARWERQPCATWDLEGLVYELVELGLGLSRTHDVGEVARGVFARDRGLVDEDGVRRVAVLLGLLPP